MTKRERCDDEEPEAGKRERLDREFAEVQAQVPIAQVKEERDCGDGQQALAPKVEQHSGTEAQVQLGADQNDEGNDYPSEPNTDAASDEDVCEENSSEVDDEYSGDVDGNDYFQFQEDVSPYLLSHCYPYVYSFFGGHSQAADPQRSTSVRIADLHPNLCGKWETKGRVVYKHPVRNYDNQNGNGTYFSFEIADEHGGEIRVVCFNEYVDEFFDMVTQDKWIVVSNGRLQTPNPRFNPEQRRCEIVLQYNSTIHAIPDEVKVEQPGTPPAGDDPVKEFLRKLVEELQSQVQDYKSKLEHLEGQANGQAHSTSVGLS